MAECIRGGSMLMAAAATAAMIRQRTLFPLTEQTHNIIK